MSQHFGKRRAFSAGTATLALVTALAVAQTPAAPSFEVASVKSAGPIVPRDIASGHVNLGMSIDGSRVSFSGLPLATLMIQAFAVKPYQISGPDWMATERFDIVAKLPDGATQAQVPAMLQALLADRFKMTFHRESRELAVYALVVGKGGSRLKEAEPEPTPAPSSEPDKTPGISIGALGPGGGPMRISPEGRGRGAVITAPQFGTMKIGMGQDGAMHLEASHMTVATLTDLLTTFVDRPVVDQTELKGAYQVTLDLSIEDLMGVMRSRGMAMGMGMPGGPMPPGAMPGAGAAAGGAPSAATASDPSGGAIFSAVQKLGLKLEPRKAPVELVVIDHMEKSPTEN